MKVSQVRKGFQTLEEAQAFAALLSYPDQFEIEEIIAGDFFANRTPIAFCVIPKRPRDSQVRH